ncbi:Response regulator containing CheY-like receiver domain [Leptospira biflexa serovar Patoc strain 'Patoc 1 (Ames)']|uniref:Putative two-component signal transduction system n=1 Tax=Leptospira biflexa serovar Patoc (strain Patoc 1 / ATCC 23582 / Paris) TaxID=456481 RepID=B0SMV2_LEPBP|nr:response regulator [Leptospira biflexa]ABZ95146.1 Response regulator containing CheY-like receiver domain [Leptospira biflexa serovar Patoc strain 'Patoc 1 (Ames)']ABZ98826.1 Putative two-component signal transduction system [Leptospira biflexa serovar Patoc strain 'Patoc 1 (Paris)']
MKEKRILVAEDDGVLGFYLKQQLSELGYQVVLAKDGKSALASYLEKPFPVVITDYEMPGLNGDELISSLKIGDVEPVIMMITGNSDPKLIVKVMKMGAFDYIIKPIQNFEIALKVKRAFEFYEMKRIETISRKEHQLRLEGQLEWIQWKEKMNSIGKLKRQNQNLFESLKHSFCQGAGFGALVSILKMVNDTSEFDGKYYKIESELMELIQTNADMAEKSLNAFAEIDSLITTQPSFEKLTMFELYLEMKGWIDEMSHILEIQKHKIVISDIHNHHSTQNLLINKSCFKKSFTEIITNACKFSFPDTTITIIIKMENEWFKCAIYNEPTANFDGSVGIPIQFENLIFEPFYRLSKSVFESYGTLDFGLGLSYVDTCIKKHNGKISIFNVKDHFDWNGAPKTKVAFQISLPIQNETK